MSGVIIEAIKAREILNGVGDPTVEVEVRASEGLIARASAPSGTSTGKHEALELRDNEDRYGGKGVLKAVANVRDTIGPALVGMDASRQREIDDRMKELDGTANKSRLGANAMLAASLAVAGLASQAARVPLYSYLAGEGPMRMPKPMTNVMAGGKHAGNSLDFEDHLLFAVDGMSFREGTRGCVEIYREVGRLLESRYGLVRVVGGAWAPPISDEREALDLICSAIARAGYEGRFMIGLDVASSQFYVPDSATYQFPSGEFTRDGLIRYYDEVVKAYPITMIEDGFEEDDFEGFRELTRILDIQVIGDDLFATNRRRVEFGVAARAANGVLFKINQAGTLTDALDTAEAAHRAGYDIVSSVRSGETEDVYMADIAVAVGARQIKLGAPVRGERNIKYNRLIRIEEELQEGGLLI